MNKRVFSLIVGLLCPLVLFSSVHINEMMVKNVSSHINKEFNFEGWVELYNSGPDSVDLSNCFFSESSSDPTMWQYEGDMIMAPNSYAVFYFDELDTLNHVGFKLDSDGGRLYLNDASGELVDVVSYPEPLRNVSYGRVNDGEEKFGFFLTSTMLASNNGVAVAQGQTVAPVFSLEGGVYNAPIAVEIKAQNGEAKIYYTTDGSEPTTSSLLYSEPVQISKVTPLRAIAVVDGEVTSLVSTATYFVGIDDIPISTKIVSLATDDDYVHGDSIGILVVGKNGLPVPSRCSSRDGKANYMNDWDRPCNFELFDEDNLSQVNQEVKIGVFGACSRTKAIKSLKVKANKTFGNNKLDYSIFSEKPSLKWKSLVLRNSGNDFGRMLFRDAFLQTLAVSGMDIDHQAYEPSVVFLNGEYYGMLGIRERTNKDFVYSNYGLDEEEFCIEETQKEAVECDEFNEILELAKLADQNAPDFFSKFDEVVDVDEFLNYFMTQIYYCNQDWSAGNNKVWKRLDGGKWRWIMYDVDYTASLYGNYMQSNGFSYAARCGYFSNFIKNDEVKRRLMTKFVSHAGTTFESRNVSYIMDSMIANVENEADFYFDHLLEIKKNEVSSWRDETEKVRNFVVNRKDYVMEHVKDSLKLGQPLPIRIYSDIEGSGFVLNDLENIHIKDFRSFYFTGSEITVEPIVPDGYLFKNWEVRQETDLLKTNDSWKYLYQTSSVDPAWKSVDFVDAEWKSGEAPLGSGVSYYHKTSVSGSGGGWGGGWGGSWGGSSLNTTTYFRKEIVIDDVSALGESLQCLAHINDGAIIYVNGSEVYRFNLPDGQVDDTIPAILEMDSYATLRFDLPRSAFSNGKNVIAVELHNSDGSSSIVFDMSLFDSKTGSSVISTSDARKYVANVADELVLKAVYEKDPDWSPSDVKLFINEVCASNKQYVDEFREDDDWIEIYNDGTSPVDLGGMYISDKRKNLTRFQIPTGQPEKTTVPAKGYLVIWADADSSAQGPLHTNFKLSKSSSQTISLSRMEDGEIVVLDSIRYVSHVSGQTFSRFSYSGDGAWCITSRPTFAAKNAYFPVETEEAGGEGNGEATYDALAEAEGGAVQVYPNPAEDYLWFSFAEEESAMISISDMTGRVLVRKRVDTGESVYVGDLSRGTYIVDVKIEEKQFSVKIIKP